MATYIPDATNTTEPTDSEKASSMGLEFRTLKAYIQTLVGQITANTSGLAAKAPLTGAGTSGTWPISISGNAVTATTAGVANTLPAVSYGASAVKTGRNTWASGVYNYNAVSDPNGPTTYAAAVGFGVGGSGSAEIAVGWVTGAGGLWYRGLRDVTDPWSAWTRVLDQANVGSYAALRDGSNATGAWAGSIAWTSVTGRPTALSQFTNDIGAGGGSGGVSSFNGRNGAVGLSSADVTSALGYTPYSSANPSNYTSLAAVAAAGYQTSSGFVQNAAYAGAVNGTSSNGYGNRTISTSPPSGGSDGDIWYQVAS